MEKVADRVSSRTVLKFGLVGAPVALYKTTGDPETPEFVKAGPHGGELERGPVKDGKRLPGSVAQEMRRAPAARTGEVADDAIPMEAPLAVSTEEEPVSVGILERGYDEEVPEDQVRRGVRLEDGRFVDLTEQLEAVAEKTRLDEMEIIGFVRREQVPRSRITGSYYLGGDGPGAPKVLALLLETMKVVGRVAVIKWTKTSRQALGVIVPGRHSGALIVLELVWASCFRQPGPRCLTHLQAPVAAGELAAAIELATAMADAAAVLDEQEDDRVRLLNELAERARLGEVTDFKVPETPEPQEDADLVDLLRASAVS